MTAALAMEMSGALPPNPRDLSFWGRQQLGAEDQQSARADVAVARGAKEVERRWIPDKPHPAGGPYAINLGGTGAEPLSSQPPAQPFIHEALFTITTLQPDEPFIIHRLSFRSTCVTAFSSAISTVVARLRKRPDPTMPARCCNACSSWAGSFIGGNRTS